jgi:hypothetical protein
MASSLNVNDLIIDRSDRPGVGDLFVSIHEFPANARSSFTPARSGYSFWYRPRREKGDTWVTVPELGLSHHHITRNHVLVTPPSLPVFGEWERAGGIVVNFVLSPRFFDSLAEITHANSLRKATKPCVWPRSPRRAVFVIKRTSTGIFEASSAQRPRPFDPCKSRFKLSTSRVTVLSGPPISRFRDVAPRTLAETFRYRAMGQPENRTNIQNASQTFYSEAGGLDNLPGKTIYIRSKTHSYE